MTRHGRAAPVAPIDSGAANWVYSGALAGRGYTDADLFVLARILSRPCPHCDARAGAWCRTYNGLEIEQLDAQHVARRRLGAAW